MIFKVDPGQAFNSDKAPTFPLIAYPKVATPEMRYEAHDPMTSEKWLVWCQPSVQPLKSRNWSAMKDTGIGTEKIHRAKLL